MTKYIAKVDHPLIQEQWEPKVGDRYFNREIEHESMILTETMLGPGYIKNTKKGLWLPRIEDVLKWERILAGEPPSHSTFLQIERLYVWAQERPEYVVNMSDVEMALAWYMDRAHNLQWSGEGWA